MLFDAIMQALGKEVQDVSRIGRKKEKKPELLEAIAGARVLLVEDNEINQQVALEILQGAGLNVTVANNGQEGVDAAMKNQYDAILMDIQMPVMDGYTATRKIRELQLKAQHSKLKAEVRGQKTEDTSSPDVFAAAGNDQQPETSGQYPVPIIAMTAHAMAGDEQKSIEAGMNDHVAKPIDPDQLFDTLQKWIQPIENRIQAEPAEVSVEAESSAEKIPEAEELPKSLPGFDLEDGLKRLQGNRKLYLKLLVDFGITYTGTAGEIREALEAKDFERAHSMVHNLKGMAGNLAATDLQTACVNLEKLVKGVGKKTPPAKELKFKFSKFENALIHALESVQSLGVSPEENVRKPSDDDIFDIPADLARDIAKRIRDAAEMGDVTTLNAIAQGIKDQSESCVPLSKRIVQMAEDFEFDGILKLADALDAC
jgi:CheY-like chemotaxis protein/HPt (histidine-containing phosphotransfer) domain-containing protein